MDTPMRQRRGPKKTPQDLLGKLRYQARDADGKVLYTELVSEIPDEPNYDAAIASLG